MLAKFLGDNHELLLRHIIHKLPYTRFSFKDLYVFQGGGGDGGHGFCGSNFICKANPKVVEHESQEGCIGQGSRTPNRADLGHCPENIPSTVDWFANHEQVYELKGFGVGAISRVGNGSNNNIVEEARVLFENEIGEMSGVSLTMGIGKFDQAPVTGFSLGEREWGVGGRWRMVFNSVSVRVNLVCLTWHSRAITGPVLTVRRLA